MLSRGAEVQRSRGEKLLRLFSLSPLPKLLRSSPIP